MARKPRPIPTRAIPAPSDTCWTCSTAGPSRACRDIRPAPGDVLVSGVTTGTAAGAVASDSFSAASSASARASSLGVIVLPGRGRPCPAGHPASGDWASSGRGDPGLGEGGAEEADEADEDVDRAGEAECGGAGCAGTPEGRPDAPGCEADGDADGPDGGTGDGIDDGIAGETDDGRADGAVDSRDDGADGADGADGEPGASGTRGATVTPALTVAALTVASRTVAFCTGARRSAACASPAVMAPSAAAAVSVRQATHLEGREAGCPEAMSSASHVTVCPASPVARTDGAGGRHRAPRTANGAATERRKGSTCSATRSYAGSPVAMRSSKWAPVSDTAAPGVGNWSMIWSSA